METIKVTLNKSKKVFTIKKYINNKLLVKYKTLPMSDHEINEEEMNTENDWKNFLKNSGNYYRI